MNLRLVTYITVVLFLGVMVAPLFSSDHNRFASHIDKAQVQHLESHTRKDKKHLQYPGILPTASLVVVRNFTFNNLAYENPLISYSSGVIVSSRAPPV
jgi:hypothetical protein